MTEVTEKKTQYTMEDYNRIIAKKKKQNIMAMHQTNTLLYVLPAAVGLTVAIMGLVL